MKIKKRVIHVAWSSHCLFSIKQRDFNVTSRTAIEIDIKWGECKQNDIIVDYSQVTIQLGLDKFKTTDRGGQPL